ncbi:MAG: HD domain-containing protein [Phycisphaerales bacterium]|jgi:3'-5' exoribonuclease|nr:HD domain-containing protein [Phycisphaerales bacterium]MBT7170581.1 HD domain-containing protein [Phycisphaerales bacterium]
MTRTKISDIAGPMPLDQLFAVRSKELRTTRNGDPFINAELGDASGAMSARMWQATQAVFDNVPLGGLLHVKGRVEDYRGTLQIVIDACHPIDDPAADLSEFMPCSPFDIEEMFAELVETLREVKNRPMRMLIKKFLEDHELIGAFKTGPAAAKMHQAYRGGLLEHTLNLLRVAKAILPLYPRLNSDLVLTGIFLHDIAKCRELSGGMSIQYTEAGQLLGHITMAAMWIDEKIKLIEAETSTPFSKRTQNMLTHIVLSHHGQFEYGSPKLPAMAEAMFLHYIDNLDAKMWMVANAVDSDPDPDSAFTPYIRPLETRLFKKTQDLDNE